MNSKEVRSFITCLRRKYYEKGQLPPVQVILNDGKKFAGFIVFVPEVENHFIIGRDNSSVTGGIELSLDSIGDIREPTVNSLIEFMHDMVRVY